MEIFSEINDIKEYIKINSNSNICRSELVEFLYVFEELCTKKNKIEINSYSPIHYYLYLDRFDKIKKIENCKKIHLNNIDLNNDDIEKMNINKMYSLSSLNLDSNKITSLEFLNNELPSNLKNISLNNNIINTGINIINNKSSLIIYSLRISLKNDDQNFHLLSFEYIGKYNLIFDYLYEVDKNLDILKDIDFKHNIAYLDLSGIKLKNINFLENETLKNISYLNLDNNLIEDISIFDKINYKFEKLSIKKNPIRRGIHVLNKKYFDNIYTEVELYKLEKEYKICVNFVYLNTEIEFYINNINELKNTIDFQNTFIKLVNDYYEEYNIFDNKLLNIMNDEPKIFFKPIICLIDDLKFNKNKINIIRNEEDKDKEFIIGNNIYMNDKNKKFIEKLFFILRNKLETNDDEYEVMFKKFVPGDEKIIEYLQFLNIHSLGIVSSCVNLNCIINFTIEHLDLTGSAINDIQAICQLTTLKSLNLSNNRISNLSVLKDAKFQYLEKLDLSHDNICDLYLIKMEEYKFHNLINLNLSHNSITEFEPVVIAFKYLKYLDVTYNQIKDFKIKAYILKNYPNSIVQIDEGNLWELGTYIKSYY